MYSVNPFVKTQVRIARQKTLACILRRTNPFADLLYPPHTVVVHVHGPRSTLYYHPSLPFELQVKGCSAFKLRCLNCFQGKIFCLQNQFLEKTQFSGWKSLPKSSKPNLYGMSGAPQNHLTKCQLSISGIVTTLVRLYMIVMATKQDWSHHWGLLNSIFSRDGGKMLW